GFAGTLGLSVLFGVAVTLSGTTTSYYADVPPGASIVVLAIALFALVTALAAPLAKRRAALSRSRAEAVSDGAQAHTQ
ncbi:MAG TPA: metal ABC transporter permease, partial [Streptomyces sp.]|nr:metal ABC transporter permease [Streptomyces sp.]